MPSGIAELRLNLADKILMNPLISKCDLEYRSFQLTKLCGVWDYFYMAPRIVVMRYPRIIADRHFRGCQYE